MSANKDKSVCDYNEFRRPWYFHGMLLDDKDFLTEQEYHASKRRLLNRMLHGSGVVCGLDLKGERGATWLEVTAGLALDCCGNEIWVNKARRFDISELLPPKNGTNLQDRDVCQEAPSIALKPKQYYIGIRYDERGTDPVSVYLPGAGCEERTCENSRVKEGYCIEVVDCRPRKYPEGYPSELLKGFCDCGPDTKLREAAQLMCGHCQGLEGEARCMCLRLEEFCEQSVPCPECGPCDGGCHVILGRIEVDEKNAIQSICLNECRDYVLSGRLVQHMIVSTLAGAEDYFKVRIGSREIPIPDVSELAHNPIKALCWILRYFVIEDGELTTEQCKNLFGDSRRDGRISVQTYDATTSPPEEALPPPPPPVTREEHEEMVKRLTAQDERSTKTAKSVTDLQKQTEKRFKEIDKLIQEMRKPQPPPS